MPFSRSQLRERESEIPWISSQGSVMQSVEPVVVGESHVRAVLEQ